MEKFEELSQEETRIIDGGAYDPLKVIQVWTFCYGAGYAIGQAVKNWRR